MTPTRRSFLATSAGTMAAIALEPRLSIGTPRLAADCGVAVIGVGHQGRAILGELQKIEGARVTALCDVIGARLRSGARRAPDAQTFADYRELLSKAKDVQAVFVATPTHAHKDIAVAALAAGKNVYCEAPLAHTVEDAQAIARAARGASTLFQSGLLARSNPVYQLARSFAISGSIFDWVSLRAQYAKKTQWRVPADSPEEERALNWQLDPELSIGLAGEFGTHQFDVFHWFLNRYPLVVRGGGSVRVHKDGRKVFDTVDCRLTFPDDLDLLYEATLGNSYEDEYELMRGSMSAIKLAWTHGWMFKEADAPTQGWEVYANRQRFHNEEGITLIADATKLASQGKLEDGVGLENPPLYYGVGDFLTSVTEKLPVVCTADEGLRATVVGILANRAITTGEEVAIDEAYFKAE